MVEYSELETVIWLILYCGKGMMASEICAFLRKMEFIPEKGSQPKTFATLELMKEHKQCIESFSYYYIYEISYDLLRHTATHPAFQQVIRHFTSKECYETIWKDMQGYVIQSFIGKLFVFLLMNDDLETIRTCADAINSSSLMKRYDYGKIYLKTYLESAGINLCLFQDFMDNLQNMSHEVQEICLPGGAMQCFLGGMTIPKWREIYCNDDNMTSVKRNLLTLMAFLEGDSALITTLAKPSYADDTSAEAYLSALAGDWPKADKLFARYINSFRDDEFQIWYQLKCAAAYLFAVKTNTSKTRIKKLKGLFRPVCYRIHDDDFSRICNGFAEAELFNSIQPPFDQILYDTPFMAMLRLLAFAQQKKKEMLPSATMQTLYEIGQKQLKLNQNLWGVYILNALGQMMEGDDDRRSEIQQATEGLGIVPWLPMGKFTSDWEKALDELQAEYSDKGNNPDARPANSTGRVLWNIFTKETTLAAGGTVPSFDTIVPIFQKLKKDGTYTAGRETNLQKLCLGELNDALTPEEKNIIKYIKQRKDYWRIWYKVLPQALDCLAAGSLVQFNARPIDYRLVRETNVITTRRKSNGDYELSLKYFVPDLTQDMAVFEFTGEKVCRYCLLSPNDKAYQILDTYGKAGVLKVPATAAEKLKDTMAMISGKVSVTGDLTREAYRDLPQLTAQIELHLLLDRSGNVFTMHFRNKPIPEAELLLRPGEGEELHMVNVEDKPAMLKRNLAKERKAFKEACAKCPSLPDSMTKLHGGELDDLELALQVLDEAKNAGFILDWKSGAPIQLSNQLDFKALRLSCEVKPGWFDVGGNLHIDEDKVLSLKLLLEKYTGELGPFVRLDDNSYLKLTKDICRQIEALKGAGSFDGETLKVSTAAMPMLSTVFQDNLPKKMQEQIALIKKAFEKDIPIPTTLQGTLRPYQEDGFRYLARLADCRIGCCLADDMGLGKTIQLLALLLREAAKGPALVVCPASLCRNWEAEAHRFAPSLRTEIMPQFNRQEFLKDMGRNCLVLSSYGVLQSEEALFCAKKWHTIILDEAQAVKNYAAKRSKSVKKLAADIRIASTGTPVENNLLELWSIFDFLNQGLLGTAQAFDAKFCDNGMPRPLLKRLVSPLIMRRRKSEVLDELPPKTEITLPIALSDDERAAYELLRRQALADLAGADETSRIAILAHLTKLKRFCCAPALLAGKGVPAGLAGSKLQRLMELVEDLRTAGNKALVFSQYVDFLHLIRDEFDRRSISYQYLDGSTPLPARAKAVNDFQAGNGDFFLISLKAGGTGLNLTAASYVILADPWWNPAVETQAADRVHRIGQTHPVTLYRLIVSDTVEEKVLELHKRKKQTSEDILDATESTAISIEELMSLFQ